MFLMHKDLDKKYFEQVNLLLQILPVVSEEACFAMKGGTAINMFFRELPRLSVDIDLTYVYLKSRDEALVEIEQALLNIKRKILLQFHNIPIEEKRITDQNRLNKLFIGRKPYEIKIEPNEVLRATVFPNVKKDLSKKAEQLFQRTVLDTPLLSLYDTYAGKICAALQRQHPRDLFDIKILYENEGFIDEIRQAFVIYLASGSRPMHELLSPNLLDQRNIFETEFSGMALEPISYNELIDAREMLIKDISNHLTENERLFLLSIKRGAPEWNLMPFKHLDQLPALQWKILNIKKMDKKKRQLLVDKLKKTLDL